MRPSSLPPAVVLASALLSIVWVRSAVADGASIGLYTDASGTTCSFTGDQPGLVTAYVVFRPDINGVRGAQFAAPIPNCFGATFIADVAPPGVLTIGSSQTGISVALPGCYGQPVNILQIMVQRTGGTSPCCEFPIVADPSVGEIVMSDCAYQNNPVTVVSSRFNANPTCECVGNSAPSLPSVQFPEDGSTGQTVTPLMRWSATDWDNNIVEHDVYLGTTPPPPLVAQSLPQPSYSPAQLLPFTQYYWRVVARDAFGLETSGPTWTFTTRAVNTPPLAPYSPVPLHGATNVLLDATLDWQAGDIDEDPLVYDVYFGTSPAPPLVATDVNVSGFDPGALDFNTAYYWRIVARDPLSQETSGPVWSFVTRPVNFPPNVPGLVSPPSPSNTQPLNVSLNWSASDVDSDTLVFDVYFGTSLSPPLVASNLSVTTHVPGGLAFATTYYWRIVVHDEHGGETSGPTWTFTTRLENYPPSGPTTPNPANAATGVFLDATLTWSATDSDGDPLVFDVYFGTSSPPPLVATDVPTASYAPADMSLLTPYYWRVVVRDSHGATTSGPTWSFTTRPANFPPNVPSSPSPVNGATGRPLNTTLAWTCVDLDGDPIVFDAYFGTSNPPPLVATGVTTFSFAPGTLLAATTYRWRIVARDAGGSTSGPTWTFTTVTNSPPNLPSSPNPPNASANRPLNQTLSWQCSDPNGDAITFDVYFGTPAQPPLVATNIAVTSYNPGPLAFSTTYRWMIVARDVHGATSTGPVWWFTTKANSPPVLSNPFPAHNAFTGASPVLTWTATDVDLQPMVHTIYFGTTDPPPFAATGLTATIYDPGPLQVATQYFWRVATSDGLTSTTGPLWTFTRILPGDVVADGALDLDDVSCAMQIFLWNPPCGGPSGYQVADVDCSANVTPADARCIHREIVDGSCAFCGSAALAGPEAHATFPVVAVGSMWTRADTLAVRLSVSNVTSLGAFGFYTSADPKLKLIAARRYGASSSFTTLETSTPTTSNSVIGAYSLSSVPVNSTEEFIELLFDMSHGLPGSLMIDGFVDDLFGMSPLYIPLGSSVDAPVVQGGLTLHQNHPNPFNPQTTISYHLPGSSELVRVRLTILDLAGRVVRRLIDEEQGSGPHEVRWEGTDDSGNAVASGVYFYVLDAAGERRTRKLVLLK